MDVPKREQDGEYRTSGEREEEGGEGRGGREQLRGDGEAEEGGEDREQREAKDGEQRTERGHRQREGRGTGRGTTAAPPAIGPQPADRGWARKRQPKKGPVSAPEIGLKRSGVLYFICPFSFAVSFDSMQTRSSTFESRIGSVVCFLFLLFLPLKGGTKRWRMVGVVFLRHNEKRKKVKKKKVKKR